MALAEGRQRVAIIGGGMAGLTAAYELSRTAELRARHAVTLYQPGFRLGGKLASGRNQEQALRNEEHGLHVWFGFYENAFRMMEEVLQRWHAPAGCPMRSIWDAVRPHDTGAFGELDEQRYRVRTLHYPRTLDSPGRGAVLPSVPGALSMLFDLACGLPFRYLTPPAKTRLGKLREELTLAWPQPGSRPLSGTSRLGASRLGAQWARSARTFQRTLASLPRLPEPVVRAAHAAVLALQEASQPRLRRWLEQRPLQQLSYHYDLLLALLRGLLNPAHGIYRDWDLDRVNDWDFRAWLEHNGAHPDTTRRWPLIEALYDSSFQYLQGDRARPSFEAGTAARFYLRATFTYKNAVAYLFKVGAGEAVIAPLYEVLRDQGVDIRFFHQLEQLELSADGRRVQRLHFVQQARLLGASYEPLFTVNALRCWPTKPRYEQLQDAAALRAGQVDFERTHSPAHESQHTLQVDQDFDAVVLALPAGVVARADGPCKSLLAAKPRFERAVRSISLVPSVSAQLWLDRPLSQQGRSGGDAMVGWAAPFSVWADMTPVTRSEHWPHRPSACIYLCGAFHTAGTDPSASEPRARAALAAQLQQHGAELWPVCAAPDGAFDWQSLRDPGGRSGPARLDAQFLRVNDDASDLCDVAAVGTSQFRPEADESEVDNLVLAGTWVRTSINSSCVEAAVMSGLAAARALGVDDRSIIGERFFRALPRSAVARERGSDTLRTPKPADGQR